jgi:hypothetical protein
MVFLTAKAKVTNLEELYIKEFFLMAFLNNSCDFISENILINFKNNDVSKDYRRQSYEKHRTTPTLCKT